MSTRSTVRRLVRTVTRRRDADDRYGADSRHGRDDRRPRDDRGGAPARYPGDFTGVVRPVYAPDLDGDPDPGEVVWTWVPYEEDHSRGKDRPVLVIGHDDPWLLAVMLSTRDHDTDPGPRREEWLDLGTGAWDSEGRPSEVRVDRVIRVDPQAVRREGAVLDQARFELVTGSLAAARG